MKIIIINIYRYRYSKVRKVTAQKSRMSNFIDSLENIESNDLSFSMEFKKSLPEMKKQAIVNPLLTSVFNVYTVYH